MNLDIETIKNTIGAFGAALTVLKQAKDMLPESSQKQEITTVIETAERQLKIAESQTAHALGYELCRKHFPPEVMLSKDDINWKCPVCSNSKHRSMRMK